MPLMSGKSPKAFEHNIKAELHAGKPKDQALAIAYNVRKRMAKKMARGGMVGDNEASARSSIANAFKAKGGMMKEAPKQDEESMLDMRRRQISDAFNKKQVAKGYAEGGMVSNEKLHPEEGPHMKESMVEAILRRRMAKGGMVGYPDSDDDIASSSIATRGLIDRSITNLNEHEPMDQNEDFLSDEEQDSFAHHNDFDEFAEPPKKRSILDSIMKSRRY